VFTIFPVLLNDEYRFGSGPSGLTTLRLGVGSILGLFISGGSSDKISKYLTKKHGGEAKPEYRLPVPIIGSFFTPIGMFWYGWTAYYHIHWILRIIGTGFIGVGILIAFVSGNRIDLIPMKCPWANFMQDGYHYVRRRCLHDICGLSDGLKRYLSLSLCSFYPTSWPYYVRKIGLWIGKFAFGVSWCCFHTDSHDFLPLWRAHSQV
jgi:hypothetical protein